MLIVTPGQSLRKQLQNDSEETTKKLKEYIRKYLFNTNKVSNSGKKTKDRKKEQNGRCKSCLNGNYIKCKWVKPYN